MKGWKKRGCSRAENGVFFYFRERRTFFSLDLRAIGLSEFFGARRKVVLRSEGNDWAPDLRSFHKHREVGVLSYLKLHFI